MELKSEKQEVELSENGLLFRTTTELEISKNEIFGQFQRYEQEAYKLRKEIDQLEKNIKEDAYNKQLEKMRSRLADNEKLHLIAKELSKPWENDLKKILKEELIKLKAEKGYSRAKKEDKHLLKHQIIAEAITKLEKEKIELDRANPAIRELELDFDKL